MSTLQQPSVSAVDWQLNHNNEMADPADVSTQSILTLSEVDLFSTSGAAAADHYSSDWQSTGPRTRSRSQTPTTSTAGGERRRPGNKRSAAATTASDASDSGWSDSNAEPPTTTGKRPSKRSRRATAVHSPSSSRPVTPNSDVTDKTPASILSNSTRSGGSAANQRWRRWKQRQDNMEVRHREELQHLQTTRRRQVERIGELCDQVRAQEAEIDYLRRLLANHSSLASLFGKLLVEKGQKLSYSFVPATAPCASGGLVDEAKFQSDAGLCVHVNGERMTIELCSRCAQASRETRLLPAAAAGNTTASASSQDI